MRWRIVLLAVLFVGDRLLKSIVWYTPETFASFGGFVHPVLNPNIAFSFSIPGFDAYLLNALLVMVVSAFVVYVAILYRRKSSDLIWWGLILIGALSNLLDRFQLGGVLDYIDLGWFPVFNVSDAYISIAVLYLVLIELRRARIRRSP